MVIAFGGGLFRLEDALALNGAVSLYRQDDVRFPHRHAREGGLSVQVNGSLLGFLINWAEGFGHFNEPIKHGAEFGFAFKVFPDGRHSGTLEHELLDLAY